MRAKIKHVCSQILLKISPTIEERKKVLMLAKDLEKKVAASAKKRDIETIVRVEGSVAKDTWLRQEPDVDVFMCVLPTIPRKTLAKISLQIAREATMGWRQVERFAEHPYLEAFVEGYRVNIVPCYRANQGKWLSATDRTPYHTDYVNKHLDENLRSEVRLLKRFMQGTKIYGAEIKIGGFSGYLCELLVIHCGSFVEVLQMFAKYKLRLIIDIENYYANREKELKLLFEKPLVVIDPVDRCRNVASAVKSEKIYTLVGAARAFLKNPSEEFFFPTTPKAKSKEELLENFQIRGSNCLFITFKAVKAVPDVLWGQLYRTQRALSKLLEINDFNVLREAVWSDEETLTCFVFELEQRLLSNIKKHVGPPLEYEKECEDFLQKYTENSCVVSGPYIESGRWIAQVPRKYVDAVVLLQGKLKDGGENAGVARLISKAIETGYNILVDGNILEIYSNHKRFAAFVTEFLQGKPLWLKPERTYHYKNDTKDKAIESENVEFTTSQGAPQ